ncbi:nucleotide sugar dehydrogenase [Tropicimonas sp. S265A]|uniref:nucleotide sugar dehydrogenase n=1 Tax=Tropicimonas sp. S265A TaxID=3415134 RepID=UPI003C7D09EF
MADGTYELLNRAAQAIAFRVIEEKPAVSIVGLGYVGAVSAACLSDLGHRVVGVDLDRTKVDAIASGRSPIHEHELGDLLSQGVSEGRISAQEDLIAAVRDTDVTFVSVGTPTAPDGGCDDRYIRSAARAIGEGLAQKKAHTANAYHVVVLRCSIPPGTTMGVMVPEIEAASGLLCGQDFGVCFNPEFLREGVAVDDFRKPPKTVIGASDQRAARIVARIFEPVDAAPILCEIETAETVKYVDNVWHAVKVTFGNEVGRLCKPLGVDSHKVMDIFCKDTKLNLSPYYLKPGFAYGGSCLPKEVRAVRHIAESHGVDLPMIKGAMSSNEAHVAEAIRMVRDTGAKRVAVLGLAFKPGTDDLRESPILDVIAALRAEGVEIAAHDMSITPDTPIASQLSYVAHGAPGLSALAEELPGLLVERPEHAIDGADAIIVTHNHGRYREIVKASFKPTIDLVRLFGNEVALPHVDGIGW